MSEQWIPHQRETWPWRVGTLKRDIQFSFFNGWGGHHPEFTKGVYPKGTIVKIVMVSRLGDVGITDDVDADRGYTARVLLDDIEPRIEP